MDELIKNDRPLSNNLAQDQADLTATVSTYLRNFLSENTRMAYTADFLDFVAYLKLYDIKITHPSQITKDHIIGFRDFLIGTCAPNTLQRKLSSLSSLFNELVSAKIMADNPCLGVSRPKAVPIRPKLGLTDSEIDALCNFYDEKSLGSLQNKTLLTFLSYTGCRISEVVGVRVSDIKTENDIKVLLINGKGSKMRKIPIHPKLWVCLKELITRRERVDDDYVFGSIQKKLDTPLSRQAVHKMLKKTLMALGFDVDKTLHSFRRGVISNLLESGHRIESVAKVSGHSNINTTKGYLVREEKIEDNPLLSLKFKG